MPFLIATIAILAALPAWALDMGSIPILQGATSDQFTQFNVFSTRPLAFEVKDSRGRSVPASQIQNTSVAPKQFFGQVSTPWANQHIDVSGLHPNEDYSLIVRDLVSGQFLDERFFSTVDQTLGEYRIVIGSCMSDAEIYQHLRLPVVESLVAKKPHMIFIIGDLNYIDSKIEFPDPQVRNNLSPQQIVDRTFESALRLPIYYLKHLVPVMTLADDHDLGRNNSDRTYRYINQTSAMFAGLFGSNPIADVYNHGPGLSRSLTLPGVGQFLFMDGRTFRAPTGEGGFTAQFGVEGTRWFLEQVSESTLPLFLIKGDAWAISYPGRQALINDHRDSYALVKNALAWAGRPYAFVSGDLHHSEWSYIPGLKAWEAAFSAFHSSESKDLVHLPANVELKHRVGAANAGLLTIRRNAQGQAQFTLESFSPGNKTNFRETLSVQNGAFVPSCDRHLESIALVH